MVGAGVFDAAVTRREEARLIPKGAHWVKAAARSFQPDANQVMLQDGRRLIAAALRVPNVMPATVLLRPDGSVAQVLPRPFTSADEIASAVNAQLGVSG